MKYAYKAKDSMGTLIKGIVEATDDNHAASLVSAQKLIPISVSPIHPGLDLEKYIAKIKGISLSELASFTRQLATMLNAGLPLTDALNILKLQTTPQFSEIIGKIMDDVQNGLELSIALAKHPKVFSKVYIALIKAGETAGVMETILNRLADTLEKGREFESKVKGALVYPIIVFIGMIGVMGLMMVVVVPKLTVMYKEFGTNLPIATRILVGLSDFSVQYWWIVALLVIGVILGIKRFLKTPFGRRWWDSKQYDVPVFGPMQNMIMLTELTRTLALLVGAGVSIVEALQVVSGAVGNVVIESELKKIVAKVEKGYSLSISFAESQSFLPIIGQMVAVGEETGKLDDVLTKLSHYFENNSENAVKGLTTAIEPIIIILMGVGVGFLVFTIVMPIYNLTSQF
ncbi:type II secretion system F family protein [Candidatus Amesbacteria bacterium]|nr:type II secretion system F family protein [Candidatus Amesbacteria bacterium]